MSKGFVGPPGIIGTHPVDIALDNLVCVVCKRPLNETRERFLILSHPAQKGLLAFACESHAGPGMRVLAKALGMTSEAPDDLKLPEPGDN